MLLRIRFDDPGWFANDPRLVITVDGASVYEGGFVGGVVASIDVQPGPRRVETSISLLGLARKQQYTVDVPVGGYRDEGRGIEVRLTYSRLAGNFARTFDTRRIDGER